MFFIGLGSLSVKNMTKTHFQWMHTVATHSPTYLHYVCGVWVHSGNKCGNCSTVYIHSTVFYLGLLLVCVCVCWFAHVCTCFVFLLLLFLQKSAALLHFKPLHLSHYHMFYPPSCKNHSIVSSHSLSCILQRNTYWCQQWSSCQGRQFKEINIIYGEKL